MRTTGWLLILVCAGLLRVRAQEGGKGGATTAVLAQEQAWSDAESRNDNRALEQIFDNALVFIEDGRLATKGECLARVRLAGSHPRQIVAAATAVHFFGSAAVVVGTYHELAVKDGKASPKAWRFIDTWVNKQGRWMLVAAGASPLPK
jgi:Domain of unknown function (DUF4440)